MKSARGCDTSYWSLDAGGYGMESLGPGRRQLFLRSQVEHSPQGDGEGGGLRPVPMDTSAMMSMNE